MKGGLQLIFPLQEIPTLNHQNAIAEYFFKKKERETNERNKEKKEDLKIPLRKF